MGGNNRAKINRSFYMRNDVGGIAKDLLGKVLCTDIDGIKTKALITETEAYAGVSDRASHAYGNRRTKRTEPMYADGGIAYVYLCYGIHHLFNVVTNRAGTPHAVLIRAGRPMVGVEHMLARRQRSKTDSMLLGGPGSLAKALGIRTDDTGSSLCSDRIWIDNGEREIDQTTIVSGPRIGVDYAGEDAARPFRFVLP